MVDIGITVGARNQGIRTCTPFVETVTYSSVFTLQDLLTVICHTAFIRNLSGLKLSYANKKGTFKGSFKAFELTGADKKKLKKYTFKVSGVVVNGVGYGVATSKKPVVNWLFMVE